MKRALLVLASVLALSCGQKGEKKETPTPDRPGSMARFSGKTTADLVKRPEVAALVDALAAEKVIESSHVGFGGAASDVFKKFQAIAEKATPDELAALVEHESPVVRGYVGEHLARKGPIRVEALAALAGDETMVETLHGCIGGGDAVGRLVIQELCSSDLPEAGPVLLATYERRGRLAADALACAAETAPEKAGDPALRALRAGGLKWHDEVGYLRALAVSAPPGACDLARSKARSDDASVQIAAADALWRCEDPASITALEELAAGKNVVVARHAQGSLFLASERRRPDFRADYDVMHEAGDRLAKVLRSCAGARRAIALAEAVALAYPEHLGAPFHRAAECAETTAAARRIAAKTELSRRQSWGSARVGVIVYLGRILDRESLPELRRSLEAGNANELSSAIHAVESLRDAASRPALQKLTEHYDASVAAAAKQAVSKL
jgi:hypothetical protein